METNNDHLEADELALLVAPGRGAAIGRERADHLDSCELCREEFAMHQREQSRMMRLAQDRRMRPGRQCPEPGEWAELAVGRTAPEHRERLLQHAAICDPCGSALRAVTENFSEPLAESELDEIQQLRTASPRWQREFAGRMASSSRKPLVDNLWLAKAAAVVLCAAGGWVGYGQWSGGAPARLLAQSYAQQRPFAMRIPGAERAPLGAQQRGTTSAGQRTQELLEAEARIARELKKDPDNRKWLGLRARAQMLAWDPESAIATLNRLVEHRPNDPEVLADLGMAYALRAEAADRAVDYSQAIDYLSRALRISPKSQTATFNRALVYERVNRYDEAATEWQRYLTLDPSGAWADEAKSQLAEIAPKRNSPAKP